MSEMNYPYSDDNMRFDEDSNQYVLTEKALMSRGIDLRSRLTDTTTLAPESVIESILWMGSDMIYQFIHEHNDDNAFQDELIARYPAFRSIIYNAMLNQVLYILNDGNLDFSLIEEERNKPINKASVRILNTIPKGLRHPITYVGAWRRWRW